jgi:hypothetical protein
MGRESAGSPSLAEDGQATGVGYHAAHDRNASGEHLPDPTS